MAVARSRQQGSDAVAELVERFERNAPHYRSAAYDETSARISFINPFFEALGWDVLDEEGRGPRREVVVETRTTTGGSAAGLDEWDDDLTLEEIAARDPVTSVPDYTFMIDGDVKFLVEAKKPSVNLRKKAPAFQVKSYAWSLRVPVGALTDFEELRVFDGSLRPEYERPDSGAIANLDLKYAKYVEHWDEIWDALSRDAVLGGSVEALVRTTRRRTAGYQPVDKAFLAELEGWRFALAADLARNNVGLDRWALAEATQRILDRIVFVRVCEDRHIEPSIVLRRYARLTDSYRQATTEFRRLDAVYNGQLFAPHFSERLNVSDGVFQEIVESLYLPYSAYRFDVIGPDLLGAVYERFLGREIVIDAQDDVSIEDKPEVRHAGGVYYTPRWVVQHIVERTLAPLLEGKTPRAAANMRVVDPACGSGAFLLGAFEFLIRWHEAYYQAHPTEQPEAHFTAADGQRRLTSDTKAKILANSIYGVDIDQQAVEVTQMSLYLKLLEQETRSTLTAQHRLFQTAYLPKLDANIKCGNSLLAPADLERSVLFGDPELLRRINPFDWRDDAHGFGRVFAERGGFDAVIGNPPYTRVQVLRQFRPEEAAAYGRIYAAASMGSFDISAVFVERAQSLLRTSRDSPGQLGFIITRQFAEADYGEPMRRALGADKNVAGIVDFGAGLVFEDVGVYTMILLTAATSQRTYRLTRVAPPPSEGALRAALDDVAFTSDLAQDTLEPSGWHLMLPAESRLLARLEAEHESLKSWTRDSIFQGVITGADYIYRLIDYGPDRANPGHRLVCRRDQIDVQGSIEEEVLRPVLGGRSDIGRFAVKPASEVLLLPYGRQGGGERFTLMSPRQLKDGYPSAYAWLERHGNELRSRAGNWGASDWYGYSRRQNLELFDAPKVLVPYMVEDLCAHYDTKSHFFVNVSTGGYGLPASEEDGPYLAALLSSRLLSWALAKRSRVWRGGWYAARKATLARLPILNAPPDVREDIVFRFNICVSTSTAFANAATDQARELATRLYAAAVGEFDKSIEDAYGVTDEERRLLDRSAESR